METVRLDIMAAITFEVADMEKGLVDHAAVFYCKDVKNKCL